MRINDIQIDEIDGIDMNDYPDFVDAYCIAAHYKSTGQELTEEELDILNDKYSSVIQEYALNSAF
jgi:hypothetical protein